MKNIYFILLVALLGFASCQEPKVNEVTIVSPEEVQTLLDMEDVQLVDVRTSKEYTAENIPGAQNIDFNSPTFDEDILKLDKSRPVILYCQKGGSSSKCAAKLKDAGFIKVYDLDGGITKWKFRGMDMKRKS
ncbi:Rhodanese-related sulfurtransferase [Flavobacteriaceae bacterium MAR_2010_188]|nr:Rhodanese-related sulfurtransferase [Flavobacteriaceae bacterium MAR_2010_188]